MSSQTNRGLVPRQYSVLCILSMYSMPSSPRTLLVVDDDPSIHELIAAMLAGNGWELSMARKQLQEIRRLIREGTQKPEWNKSLKRPASLLLIAMVILTFIMKVWR